MAFQILLQCLLFVSCLAFPDISKRLRSSSTYGEVEQLSPRRTYPRSPYQSPGWIPYGQDLEPQLSQEVTNGKSVLGTEKAPKLPHFLGDSMPTRSGKRWERRGASSNKNNADYGNDPPNTGVTRHYDFTITEMNIAPDGVSRSGMVVNGGFPGPTIEANWGDYIEVVVKNDLPSEGTSIHWHGLLQTETPYYDGVPGTQQCPIAPGSSLTYKFRADLYGTSFYHSHYSAQYTGGIVGAMIIYGPHDNVDYDDDLGPVILEDWYHEDYYDLVEQVMAPASEGLLPPESTNNLINGKMNYPCVNATGLSCTPNAGISKFFVESGKTYRMRLINAGAEGMQKFSIDGAKLTIFANDFVPVKPYEVDVVTLGVGQRTDILFKADGKSTDAVWMRSDLGNVAFSKDSCTVNDGVSPIGMAAIYYEKADKNAIPKTKSSVPLSQIENCLNDPLSDTEPFYPLTPGKPDTVQKLKVTYGSNGTNDVFFINNSSFRADYNSPVLLQAVEGNLTFPTEYNIYNFGESKSVQLILENHADTSAHPMHLHGHNMWVLAVGEGEWDGTITNPQNPQRRDVQLLPNAPSKDKPSYIVLQITANNPGVWPLHCHIAWHVSAGLYVSIMEGTQQMTKMKIPSSITQTCKSWAAWTSDDVPDEIDSGL